MDSMRDRLYPLSERASLLALTRREGQALQSPHSGEWACFDKTDREKGGIG